MSKGQWRLRWRSARAIAWNFERAMFANHRSATLYTDE